MSDVALDSSRLPPSLSGALRRFGRSDRRFRWLTLSAAWLVLLIFIGIIASLSQGASLAFRTFGLGFFTSTNWNPVTEKFGAFPAIYGTVVSSALAMLVAVPVGIGVAIFLTE